MKENLAFFLLFLPLWMLAQNEEEIKYEIIAQQLKELLGELEFGYYNVEKPIDPEEYKSHQPDSIYTFFDLETYEEYKMSGAMYDSLYHQKLPALIAAYQQELKLWRVKEELGKPVLLMGSNERNVLKDLEKHAADFPKYQDILKQLSRSKKNSWDVSKIKHNTNYLLLPFDEENYTYYKYAFVGVVWFSDVILNKAKNRAVLQLGIHYKIPEYRSDAGSTGFGGILFLEKRDGKWQVEQSVGLWEE